MVRKSLFAALPAILLFGGAEIALRLAGFEFHGIPRHFQFGANVDHDLRRNVAVPDADLFWRLKAGENARFLVRRKHVHPNLRARTGADRTSPGGVRAVSMGDSCTFFGSPSYPERLESRLVESGLEAEVFSASVPGYTSYQGLRWFETEIAAYRPDWVTVYYGWNDHWLAMQATDRELGTRTTRSSTAAARIASNIRLVQLGTYLRARLFRLQADQRPERVPLDHYRENLEELCRRAREEGAGVIFVTAPSDLDPGDVRRLTDLGQVTRGRDVRSLHEEYNAVVRDVAAACRAEIVDFAGASTRTAGFVSEDGIHLTEKGIDWLGDHLAKRIVAEAEGP